MANYENGANTRQAIVAACKRLFYEKGYYETSYGDICKAAHVNRGTIYYHFDSKEAMRYDVMWEYTTDAKRIAEKYCDQPQYHYILAMYILWHLAKRDEHFRCFQPAICIDYPVYTGKKDCSYYYSNLTDGMWGAFFDKKLIPQLAFASVYGYIMSCVRMLCEHPEKYEPWELFRHCVDSSISIWGIPRETMDQIWIDVKNYLSQIPEEEMQICFD